MNNGSKLAVLSTLAEGSAEERREAARQIYRASADLGEPLSAAALAEMHERSRTWARDRINEVRAEGGMPPVITDDGLATTASEAVDEGVATTDTPTVGQSPMHDAESGTQIVSTPGMPPKLRSWPVLLLALPAFVAIWGGWVGLGEMAGFGPIHLLPGIADSFVINSAITLPIGVEAYAAYALRVWLSGIAPTLRARRFAMWSAIGSLVLGMAGQVAYHLMAAAGMVVAPWQITTFVSCLPVVVLGCGAALAHLLRHPIRSE